MAVEVQYRGDNADAGPSDGVWFDVDPLASPKKSFDILEDFVGISSLTLAGTSAPADGTEPGGTRVFETDDSAKGEFAFKLADDKDLTFECRLKPAAAAGFQVGLQNSGDTKRLSFVGAAGTATLKHDDNSEDETIAAKALTTDAYIKLGFRVRGAGDDTEITAYADGVKVASKKLSDLEASALTSDMLQVAIVSSTAAAIEVDWIKAVQLR
ncbi:hypothetical protein [uncultured Mediterranean phage]|nr:hypothetical protein [uncultured Mediterranean phage]